MSQPPDLIQLVRDAQAGIPRAQFLLGQHCYKRGDLQQMIHWLGAAANAGLKEANEALAYSHEIGRGVPTDPAAAISLYDQAIGQGSVLATYRKAELLYKSRHARSQEENIRALLLSAADNRFAPATRAVNYLAAEAGLSGQDRQNLPLFPPPADFAFDPLSDDPAIRRFDQVLTQADCEHLIALATPHLARADVIDPGGGKQGFSSEARTNLSTYLAFNQVDIIGRYVELKILNAVGGRIENSEPMSILCYSPGEYYQPHFDYFSPDLAVTAKHLEDGGQRISSAVTYLSQPTAGGSTSFPELDITVPARLGSTLWFRNCTDDGEPDPRSLHSGDPVTQGQKWVVTKWFRQRDSGYLLF